MRVPCIYLTIPLTLALTLTLTLNLHPHPYQHGADTRCMERLCRCYKHTARNCGDGFKAVLPRLLPQIVAWFEQKPHSCFLYVANVCIANYGNEPALLPLFNDSFKRMAASTHPPQPLTPTPTPTLTLPLTLTLTPTLTRRCTA